MSFGLLNRTCVQGLLKQVKGLTYSKSDDKIATSIIENTIEDYGD